MVTHTNRPIQSGTAFRNGKLYSFSRRGILVVSQWPDMRAWRKTPKGNQWQHVRPEMSLEKTMDGWNCVWGHREPRQRNGIGRDPIIGNIEPVLDDSDANAEGESWEECAKWQYVREQNNSLQAEYLSPVPEEILLAVSRFANRHWHLLNLVARCPRVFDLVRATPALALALSSPWVFRKNPPRQPLRSVRSLLGKQQTDIVAWLGLPDAWSTVRILRKLPPGECTVLNLLHLRDLFRSRLKTLQHIPHLNGPIIRLMTGEAGRYQVSPRFLQEIAMQPGLLDRSVRMLRDTLWMRDKLESPGIIALRSYNDLTRAHDHCVDQLGRMDSTIISPPPFPHPPLIASSPHLELEPVLTACELLEEARIQRNCVGGYGTWVLKGNMYLYRLLSPERATVAVTMDRSGQWRLDEIKSRYNSEVHPDTLSAVLEWIASTGNDSTDGNDKGDC